ncbi:MAG: 23S rRNA (guanosine(2251)-2'-O)-methyltransferase RlmB [Gammaproteobacteria bacterium]|nr:23S rRNA (guanosine(2251)-2'-O)-methyltransferase RlmB [Gammaproteobacteria bacterium]
MKTELIFGMHTVTNSIEHHPHNILSIFLQKNIRVQKLNSIIKLAKQHDIPVEFIAKEKLDKLLHNHNHQGVVAKIKIGEEKTMQSLDDLLDDLDHPAFLLILDSIQDPHNLGACLRTANAAGVDAVIIPKNGSCQMTSTVKKIASGATEFTPLISVTNLVNTMKDLKKRGIWLFGAAGEAKKSIYKSKLEGPIAIVMGAEDKGLRRLTRETCDHLISIPMQGEISSLNVSCATAVCLFEAIRQKIT